MARTKSKFIRYEVMGLPTGTLHFSDPKHGLQQAKNAILRRAKPRWDSAVIYRRYGDGRMHKVGVYEVTRAGKLKRR